MDRSRKRKAAPGASPESEGSAAKRAKIPVSDSKHWVGPTATVQVELSAEMVLRRGIANVGDGKTRRDARRQTDGQASMGTTQTLQHVHLRIYTACAGREMNLRLL